MNDLIGDIVAGKWVDPDNGQAISVPVKKVMIEAGIKNNAADIIRSLNIGVNFAVVCDDNTYDVLGHELEKALGDAELYVFKDGLQPSIESVNKLMVDAEYADVLIAVGSGTINDICKYASYLAGKPYIVFGTAPSMNGYSSANASIIEGGHRKTLAAHLPEAIFLDLDILAAAPVRLIRSGLGDSLCRSTAQADWLLSHLLLGTEYKKAPFELLKPFEKDLFDNSRALVEGDGEALKMLASSLVVSGFGMYISGGSYPASQGEHLIAHTMETVFGERLPKTYHGEQVGVATVTMAKLQEGVLKNKPVLSFDEDCENEILKFFGEGVGKHCLEEYEDKIAFKGRLEKINEKIENNWHDMLESINDVVLSSRYLESVLKNAGAPINPEGLGWDENLYKKAVHHAKYMRRRFTFLDVA